jgi:hypothetical protein
MLVSIMLWHFGGFRVFAQAESIQRRTQAEIARRAPLKAPEGNRFDALLGELKEIVERGAAKTRTAPEKGFAAIEQLTELRAKLAKENEKNENYFQQIQGLIESKKLSGEILDRQREFVRDYDAKYQTLVTDLDSIETAHKDATGLWGKITGKNKQVDWNSVVANTLGFLEANDRPLRERHFDPHNLPHRSLKAEEPIPPKLTRQEMGQSTIHRFRGFHRLKECQQEPGAGVFLFEVRPTECCTSNAEFPNNGPSHECRPGRDDRSEVHT